MAKKKNEVKKVVWFKKNLIKLVGEEEPYPLADNVIEASNFTKYPINEGDTVEFGKGQDEDGDTVIVFLRKQKSTKKTETSTEDSGDAEVRTVTIKAVRKDKTAVKIDDGTWPKVKDNLVGHEALKAKNTIKVKIKDNVIVAIKTTSTKTEEKPTTSTKSTGNSIDRQSAVKSASEIVKALIEAETISNVKQAKDALIVLSNTAKELIAE